MPLLLSANDPKMQRIGDVKFIFEIRQSFFISLANQQREINRAILQQDLKNTQDLAHHILGACIYCGTPRLQKTVEEILDAIRQNKTLSQSLADQFNDVINATLRALRQP